jgi:hypothetical protein
MDLRAVIQSFQQLLRQAEGLESVFKAALTLQVVLVVLVVVGLQ